MGESDTNYGCKEALLDSIEQMRLASKRDYDGRRAPAMASFRISVGRETLDDIAIRHDIRLEPLEATSEIQGRMHELGSLTLTAGSYQPNSHIVQECQKQYSVPKTSVQEVWTELFRLIHQYEQEREATELWKRMKDCVELVSVSNMNYFSRFTENQDGILLPRSPKSFCMYFTGMEKKKGMADLTGVEQGTNLPNLFA